jgi:Flp pilus assembly protein TadG
VRAFKTLRESFLRDRRGATAVVFGLSLVPIVGAVGVSVDLSRAERTRAALQNAVDAAALAAARELRKSGDATAAEQQATAMFTAARPAGVQATMQTPVIDVDARTIDLRATAQSATMFMAAVSDSYQTLTVNAAARSLAGAVASGLDLEVALMLDVTISMSQASGTAGQTKLQAMQSAAKTFIGAVVQDKQTPHVSRAALVPFSSAVNVGTYFKKVTNTTATGGWTSVVERSGASAFTDDPPRAGAWFTSYRTAHTTAIGSSSMIQKLERNRTSNIPVGSYVLPLTSDKAALNAAVDALKADGTTAGHIGTAWSWYMLSPNWGTVWTTGVPAAYDATKTAKVAVLMSDFDYNVYYQSANGDMNAQTRALCTNMKAAGITVYTIGFQVDTSLPNAVDLFTSCASDPSKAISAQTGADLVAAYTQLAETVRDSIASPVRLAR